jgi:uncharacterized protein YbjT (DUF2867 family)
MLVLVTGGTGHLGRAVVAAARAAGHTPRILSRRPRPSDTPADAEWATADLATGAGLPDALAGADAVVHAASAPRQADADVQGTQRLARAARAAGTGHVVYVSIVGVDRIPYAYYQRKLACEDVLAASGVPHSILRATQFHSFVDALLGAAARLPLVLPLPAGFHMQSVATEEVAARLLRALADGPHGRLPDFGGPEPLPLAAAAAAWKAARGVRKPTVPVPLPGRTAAAFRAGANLVPDGERGAVRWQDWLAARVAA